MLIALYLIIIPTAIWLFKKKRFFIAVFLISSLLTIQIYRWLNPIHSAPQKVLFILNNEQGNSSTPVDSLLSAVYYAEQLLANNLNISSLPLKDYLKISTGIGVDSLKSIIAFDEVLSLSLTKNGFLLDDGEDKLEFENSKIFRQYLIDRYKLSNLKTVMPSDSLLADLKNIWQQKSLTESLKFKSQYFKLKTKYSLLSHQDSSKIRDGELEKLIPEILQSQDYWWKKDGFAIRVWQSKNDYNSAFAHLKKNQAIISEQADYFYLLSKFSKNRFREFGFSDKFALWNLAKAKVGLDLDLMAELAENYYLAGFNNESEQIYKLLVRLFPNELYYRLQLGVVISRQNRVAEAAKIFLECHKIDSTDWRIDYNLAIQYFWQDKELAKKWFLKALAKGDTTNSWLFLGRISFDEKKYDQALEYFRNRVKRETGRDDPNWLEALKGIRRSREMIAKEDSLKVGGKILE